MNRYSLHPGIILIELNGAFLLVADREGRKDCPYVMPINETGALIWKGISQKMSRTEIIQRIQTVYEIEDSIRLEKDVSLFIENLDAAGYILHEELEECVKSEVGGNQL